MSALAVERIGTCELCGGTDHHLVDGICPACRPKCMTIAVSGNPRFVARAREAFMELGAAARVVFSSLDMPDDEALGDEADVRHVRRDRT